MRKALPKSRYIENLNLFQVEELLYATTTKFLQRVILEKEQLLNVKQLYFSELLTGRMLQKVELKLIPTQLICYALDIWVNLLSLFEKNKLTEYDKGGEFLKKNWRIGRKRTVITLKKEVSQNICLFKAVNFHVISALHLLLKLIEGKILRRKARSQGFSKKVGTDIGCFNRMEVMPRFRREHVFFCKDAISA